MDDLDGLIELVEQATAEPPSGAADRNRAAPREPERGPRPTPGRDRSGGGYWEAADYKGVNQDRVAADYELRSVMRSIHFRVEDDLYLRIQEEADQQDLSVASFARVATVARTILWGVRRGAPWADPEMWGEALEAIEEIERRDTAARAKLARERRVGRSFREKLKREGERAASP